MDETEITVRFFCTCQSSQTRGYEHKIPSAEHSVNCQVSIQSFHMRDAFKVVVPTPKPVLKRDPVPVEDDLEWECSDTDCCCTCSTMRMPPCSHCTDHSRLKE